METPALAAPVARDLCTDCGISRTDDPKRCGRACQFIRPDHPGLERRVHGRERDPARPDELHFGPFRRMLRASLVEPRAGAQWTGIATRIAARLLETGSVDAVLGPARERGYRRLAIVGIPCQVYALRALEAELGFERLYVIGTPCSDNTTTENFHRFLALLDERPGTIAYLEFRADYHVELRFDDGRVREIPFLQLPISKLPRDFFPLTCRTCVDYTNVLADVTVGYMGGAGEQWLLVRNERGEELIGLLGDELRSSEPGSAGRRRGPVTGFLRNTERAAGGLPLRGTPAWLRPLVGWLMPRIGPRGLEFARARVEMKAIETVLHLRRERPRRMRHMIPAHVWALVRPYGLF